MDVFHESLDSFVPSWGTQEEWNSAYDRLESYLIAHELNNRLHRTQVITQTLQHIEQKWKDQPLPAPLVTLAVRELQNTMDQWFSRIMDLKTSEQRHFTVSDGRVALFLSDAPHRWPYAVFAGKNIPEDFRTTMKKNLLQAGPELAVSNMVPREIDLGLIPELADNTLDALNRKPVIKALVVWIIYLAWITYLFWATR